MGYDPTKVEIREAVNLAIVSALQAKIPDLQTSFLRDSHTSQLIAKQPFSPLDPLQCVRLGDPESEWPESEGAIRCYVSGGAPKSGMSRENSLEYIGLAEKKQKYFTFISCVLHPNSYIRRGPNTAHAQAEDREYAIARMEDWLSAVFNDPVYAPANMKMTLSSTHYNGAGDKLNRCYAPQIYREVVMRGPDDAFGMFCIHALHEGIVGG